MSSQFRPTQSQESSLLRSRLRSIPVPALHPLGRDEDIARINRWFAEGARLVTLVGPPGSGKTRLSLHVASAVERALDWQVAFVSLGATASADSIVSLLAQSIDSGEERHLPIERLLSRLNQFGPILIVLDNLEHLDGTSEVIATLTNGAPDLRLLTTSRTTLRISGERKFEVTPLPLPDPSDPADVLMTNAAVRLFTHRASGTSYAITLSDLPLVALICIQLNGLPLAIELAAAQVPRIGIHNLLHHLEAQDHVLDMGANSAEIRHRSLRTAIGASFDLLSPNLQRAFALLSVFVGGFGLPEAERYLAGQAGINSWIPAPSTLARANQDGDALQMSVALAPITGSVPHILQLLVEANLIQSGSGVDGQIRYQLLDSIREFGGSQLRLSGEESSARRSHSAVVTQFALSAAAALWTGKDRLNCMRRFEVERDNLRSALDWVTSASGSDGFIAHSLAASSWFYLLRAGTLTEARTWLDKALAIPCDRPWANGLALNGLAFVAWSQGQYELAEQVTDTILNQMATSLNPIQVGAAHFTAGLTSLRLGRPDDMVQHMELARPLLELGGDLTSVGFANMALGTLARLQLEHDRAEQLFQMALDRFEASGHEWGIATTLYNAGALASDRNDRALALDRLTAALDGYWAQHDWLGAGHCIAGLAVLADRNGHASRARQLITAAVDTINDSSTSFTPIDLERYRALAKSIGVGPHLLDRSRDTFKALSAARDEAHEMQNELRQGLMSSVQTDPLAGILTGEQLDAVNLRCEGMTVEQIGNALGRDRNTIYDRLHRARIRLNVTTNEELVARVAAMRRGDLSG